MTHRGLDDIVEEHYRWASSTQPRIPLGWSFFDGATSGGIAMGEVAMFLAYSGVGKTWWAINVAANNPSMPMVIFSLEMHSRMLAQRLAACYCGVPTWRIEQDSAAGHSAHLEKTRTDFPHLSIQDDPGMSLKDMAEGLREAQEAWGGVRPRLVIVDYLELVRSSGLLSSLEAIDKTSREVKNFARAEDVALIVLHQVNANESARASGDRDGYRKVADNGHLPLTRKAARFGGDVAADYTIGAFRPGLDPEMPETVRNVRDREIFFQLLKNRGGSKLHLGGVPHDLDTETWRITEKNEDPDLAWAAPEPVSYARSGRPHNW